MYTELTHQPLMITGEVPHWLSGCFVRNGPIRVEINGKTPKHWFDGLAMVHSFNFDNGKIYYSNKFLRTDAYHQFFEKHNIHYLGFDNPSKISFITKLKYVFFSGTKPFLANANVNVAEIDNQYIAMTEIPSSIRFDINTMSTLGPLQYQDDLPQKNCFESAHMQFDRQANEKINYIVKYGFLSYYIIYSLEQAARERKIISKLKVRQPAYMHSFAITQHYIILVEFPLVLNPLSLLFSSKPFIENYVWQPKQGTNFLIVERKTGKLLKTLKDKAFFAFHHVNAYEKEKDIILDIVMYDDASIIQHVATLDQASSQYVQKDWIMLKSKLMRYVLSPETGSCNAKVILEEYFEFPRINPTYNAYPYQFIYGVDPRPLSKPSDLRSLYKIDMQTQENTYWQEPGMLPGEPVFIPSQNAKAEDEGLIVSLVLDVAKQDSFLLMLDAKTFKEIARAETPFSIPMGLHGQYFKTRP